MNINFDFFVCGEAWREKLAAVKSAIIDCEPSEALALLDAMIAELDPERDTAQ